jgi:SAM-dependent methyltransferase
MIAARFQTVRIRLSCLLWLFIGPSALPAADHDFLPYERVKAFVPADLHLADEAQWSAWRQRQDQAIRARLEQGDLDSVVNLLLFGTSFTKQPRIRMDRITEASKAGVLRARVDDMVVGLRHANDNERLAFVQELLSRRGIDPRDARQAGLFLLNNLLRVVEERVKLGERVAGAQASRRPDDPDSLLDRGEVFRDRGVSLDTAIVPDFLVEQALRDLKNRGLLREGQVARVAVVGPGLDFIDKNEDFAYDYYPQQTLQPFALYDSLLRLKLATGGALSLSILDISPRVIQHVERAAARAAKNQGYVIQLPRDLGRVWNQDMTTYWQSLGDQVGSAIEPIRPPAAFPQLESRAVRIRPEVVRSLKPTDLNIVLEHLNLSAQEEFDLIVGTNIFIYYDAFQQKLALENAGEMLKPGGFLITNDKLPEIPGGAMRLQGITLVNDPTGGGSKLAMGWYQKNGAGTSRSSEVR